MSEIRHAPIKLLTTHNSDEDKLRLHLQGKLERHELSPKLQEKVERIVATSELIRKYVSRLKVCPMLEKSMNLSRAQAYRLYEETQRLFGETSIKNQQFWLDIQMGAIEEDIAACRMLKDYRSVAALRKLQVDLIEKLMGSGDAQLYERIQPPEFVVGFFPRSMKMPLPKDKELRKLVSEKLQKIAEDVEYEE